MRKFKPSSPKVSSNGNNGTSPASFRTPALTLCYRPLADFSAVLEPAGIEDAIGAVAGLTPNDVRRAGDPALKDWLAWMRKYQPNASTGDLYNVQGYTAAQLMALVLKNCGDDLSRDNIIRQIKSLNGVALPMMLPGITVHTDPRNVTPIRQLQMARFDGKS